MATPKPTVSTAWASDASAAKTSPGSGVQQWGLPKRAGIPHDMLNAQFDNIDQWLAWLRANVNVFASIKELVESEDLAQGDLGTVRGDSSVAPFGVWVQTSTNLGSEVPVQVATDGARLMVVTDRYVWSMDPTQLADPLEVWDAGGSFFNSTPRAVGDGAWLHTSSGTAIRIFDPTVDNGAAADGGQITHGANILDIATDGQHLYVVDTSENITCYQDIFDTPTALWSNNLADATSTTCVATNGRLVAVGHDYFTNGGTEGNVTLYDALTGPLPQTLAFDSVNEPEVVKLAFSRDHLLVWTNNGKLYIHPAWSDEGLSTINEVSIPRTGFTTGVEFLDATPAAISVCGDYVAQAFNSSTVGYIALFRIPRGDATLVPVWLKRLTAAGASNDCIYDLALGPDHLAVAHQSIGGNVVLSTFRLPSAGQPRRYRKATSTDRYRAPWYGAVVEGD